MESELKDLNIKIINFKNKILSKEKVIIFEDNDFDIFIGLLLSKITIFYNRFLKKILNFLKDNFVKMIKKIYNYLSEQNQIKEKVIKQQLLLEQNIKFNQELSKQIRNLGEKIEQNFQKEDVDRSKHIKDRNKTIDKENTEMPGEIEFFQKENLRISNELFEMSKKYEIMKEEINKFQNQRSNLIDKINSVNDVIKDSNIVTSVFENKQNDNKIEIIDPQKIKQNSDIDLDKEVSKIFSKQN